MSSPKKVRARAVVTMTISFQVEGVWGGDCPVSQIQKQAVDSALGVLRNGRLVVQGVTNSSFNPEGALAVVDIVGQPHVKCVAIEEER